MRNGEIGNELTLVQLQELERATGAPSLLLCKAVVGVALVFGRLAHGDGVLRLWRDESRAQKNSKLKPRV